MSYEANCPTAGTVPEPGDRILVVQDNEGGTWSTIRETHLVRVVDGFLITKSGTVRRQPSYNGQIYAVPCPGCAEKGMRPSHDGSERCQSGSIASGGKTAHCSCDVCF